jgi:hypothetical protein
MARGIKTGGRQKGTPNKMTTAAKDAFALAFDDIGGPDALAEWGRENRTEFYKLFSKLIPIDATVNGNMTVAWPLPKSPLDQ